eukprot:3901464-Prymnesium_polylepis.1
MRDGRCPPTVGDGGLSCARALTGRDSPVTDNGNLAFLASDLSQSKRGESLGSVDQCSTFTVLFFPGISIGLLGPRRVACPA